MEIEVVAIIVLGVAFLVFVAYSARYITTDGEPRKVRKLRQELKRLKLVDEIRRQKLDMMAGGHPLGVDKNGTVDVDTKESC